MMHKFTISRRGAMALGAGALVSPWLQPAMAAAARPVVVELFTSQGCSSCPPADKILGEIKTMPGVIAMSINVDYWDYLGWRDTLADKSHSQRQYDYARARGDMDVYTPQIIVDGGSHYVGSNRSVVMAAIKRALEANTQSPVSLIMADDGDEITISASGHAKPAEKCTIWLCPIAPQIAVKVEKGENSGRNIVYHNVVRKIIPAGVWKGEPATLRLAKKTLLPPDCTACVALLQPGVVGPVMAAASWGPLAS